MGNMTAIWWTDGPKSEFCFPKDVSVRVRINLAGCDALLVPRASHTAAPSERTVCAVTARARVASLRALSERQSRFVMSRAPRREKR